MKITTGEFEIYESGIVIISNDESITFSLAKDLNVILKFSYESSENNDSKLKFNFVSNTELIIDLINFESPFGVGTIKPILIGHLNNKELFLSFRVQSLVEKSNKTIQYCWYFGKEIKK